MNRAPKLPIRQRGCFGVQLAIPLVVSLSMGCCELGRRSMPTKHEEDLFPHTAMIVNLTVSMTQID